MKKHLLSVAADDPRAPLPFLVARLGTDAVTAAGWIGRGLLRRGERPLAASDRLSVGQRLTLRLPAATSPAPVPRVVHRDDEVLVIDKPSGLLSQPSPGESASVAAWIADHGGALVHRLDRGASGLLLAARTSAAHAALQRALADGRIERVYLAVVAGVVAAPGEVRLRIARHPGDARRRIALPEHDPAGQPACTRYTPTGSDGVSSRLAVMIDSGRTHQIRLHCAALGHPLLGDTLYGGPPASRLLLHATRLAFPHPRTGARMVLESPAPAGFADATK